MPYVLFASILWVIPAYWAALAIGIGLAARGLVPLLRLITDDPIWGELSHERERLLIAVSWSLFTVMSTAAAARGSVS
ncbi:MAG: hypothetical protein M3277_11605 [Actinomycetota bacterium]|nr:hypothetical protein [Actinomycetota bacterium]